MRTTHLSTLMLAGSLAAAPAAAAPVLTVYTYDSFVAEWGPGPTVEEAFEADCGCDLQFVATGDGAALLARLLLEGEATEADVVLGLDTSLTARATASGLFAPRPATDAAFALPVDWTDPTFLPYDWGWFAFVYDKTKIDTVPADFEALAASDLTIVIEDPRSSTPGLGLLLWVKKAYGARAAEADLVLAYTASPASPLAADGDDAKAAAPFAEGRYLQVEAAATLKSTQHGDLADGFLAFITYEAVPATIRGTNWMYPAGTP